MGLFQKAVETYEFHQSLAGQRQENQVPLAPLYHLVTNSQIEITLDQDGRFVKAESADLPIIIPVTENSAGRSGKNAFEWTHPLCEQLKHLTRNPNCYLPKLKKWLESDHSHPKLPAVYRYVEAGTIISDLAASGIEPGDGSMIRWRIIGADDHTPSACWEDTSLFDAYTAYAQEQNDASNRDLCLVSGRIAPAASKHPKTIVRFQANAKLISANDETDFTFRGRFSESRQAATVSLDASQKAHNALKWLIENQGESFGGRTFVCWNPQGKKTASATGPFLIAAAPVIKPSDYRNALRKTLQGYQTLLTVKDGIVIAAFDAATTGRLSITYYNELLGSDFLDRLYEWDAYCCWQNGPFGIQSPSLYQIANYAYGVQRIEKNTAKLVTDDRIMRQQMQRLLFCRIDRARIPADILKALVDRASRPQAYEETIWRRIVFAACAVMNKFLTDQKGMNEMDWSLDRKDRSFQYGRLLATMERIEVDYYERTKEERQASAIKALSDYRQRPWSTYERLNRHLTQAYLPRVYDWQRRRYAKLKDEIVSILAQFPENELNKPLEDVYLMGYDLQHAAFYKKNNTEDHTEEDEQ